MADHFNTPQPPDAAEQEQLAPHRVDSEGTFDYLERFSGMDISHLSGNRSTTLDADAVSIVSPAEVKARLGFAAPVFAEISMTTDDRKLLLNYWVLSLDRAGRPGDLLIVDPKQYDVQNKRGFIGVHGEQPLTVNVLNGKYKDRFTLDGQYPAPNFTIQRKGNGVVIRNAEGWYQLDVSRPRGWRRAYGQPFGAMALAGNHEPTIIKPETSVDDTVATDDVNHAEDTSDIAADDGDARNDVVIAATEVSAETVHTESSDAAATSSEGHREDASETADTASEAAPHSDTAPVLMPKLVASTPKRCERASSRFGSGVLSGVGIWRPPGTRCPPAMRIGSGDGVWLFPSPIPLP